jgi:cytochrome P450
VENGAGTASTRSLSELTSFVHSKQGRQIARPFFSRERISDFHIFEQTSTKTLDLIANRAATDAPIDVQDLLQRFTLDAAALFLWGTALNTLDQPLTQPGRVVLGPKGSAPADGVNEWDVFTNAFETVAVLITRRGVQGDTWPLLELTKDKTEEPIQVIMDWLDGLVNQAMIRKAKRSEVNGAKVSPRDDDTVFLDYLADRTDGAFFPPFSLVMLTETRVLDVEHIRYELITFLIASRDTVSAHFPGIWCLRAKQRTDVTDLLPFNLCDLPTCALSRCVSSSEGRSP